MLYLLGYCFRGRRGITTGVISILYLFTFLVVLPFVCRDWPYSKYFHGDGNAVHITSKVKEQNKIRVEEAQEYLHRMDKELNKKYYKYIEFDDTDIAVGVITMKRKNAEGNMYLTQTVVAADLSLKQNSSFKKPIVFLCNIDPDPAKHTEAVGLSEYFHTHTLYNTNEVKANSDRFEKEKEDYAFCLIKALSYRPKYVLLLEDDAQPRDQFFDNLKYLLHHRIDQHAHYDHDMTYASDWFLVKLYYPDKWRGFGNEVDKLLELVALGCIGGFLFYLSAHSSTSFVLGAIYFMLFAFLIGRPYLINIRRLSIYMYRVLPAPGCCTQGVLYTATSARTLAHELGTLTCSSKFAVDLAIDSVASKMKGLCYAIEPNLIRHIGMVSTVRGGKQAAEFLE